MRTARLSVAIGALLLAAGCGRSDKDKPDRDFTLTVSPSFVEIVEGQSGTATVTVTRDHLSKDITLHLEGLPPGVTAAPVVLADGALIGTLTLVTTSAATHGESTPLVVGSASEIAHSASLSILVKGTPGALDESLTGDGALSTDFGAESDAGYAVLVDSASSFTVGGNMLNAGNSNFAVARYLADGTLDPSFATGGRFFLDVTGGYDAVYSLTWAPGGGEKLLAVGEANQDTAAIRLNPDGTIDPIFGGGDGRLTSLFPNFDYGGGIAVTSSGDILIAGGIGEPGLGGPNFLLTKMSADGILDPAFAAGVGRASKDIATSEDGGNTPLLEPDGGVIVVGSGVVPPDIRGVLVRWDSAGVLDALWGTGGQIVLNVGVIGGGESLSHAVRQPDGKIVAVGQVNDNDWLVVRLESDGNFDPTFGTGGVATLDFFGFNDFATAVALQADGRIVVVGLADTGPHNDYAVARFEADGTLDATFGNAGVVLHDFGDDDFARGVAIGPDGRIVVVGETRLGGVFLDIGVLRLWP